jgi:hypothetical protein
VGTVGHDSPHTRALAPLFKNGLKKGSCSLPLTPSKNLLYGRCRWVSNATRGKITEIVSEDVVKQAVVLLINAVYFKGMWALPFKK